MQWFLNDHSIQGQFPDHATFELAFARLLSSRSRSEILRNNLRLTRSFGDRLAYHNTSIRRAVQQSNNRDFRSAVLLWLDRNGPFVEDDALEEGDNYFTCFGVDVTEGGLGETARRVKAGFAAASFSFSGGAISFDRTPLTITHGLDEEPIGIVEVENIWTTEVLVNSAIASGAPVTSWQLLVEGARALYPNLILPDDIYRRKDLAREPFDEIIRDRTLALLKHLNDYMNDRTANGEEGQIAQSIVRDFFVGERALFSPESPNNQRDFRNELTFPDPDTPGEFLFAHWHGKISRRFYRIHFEWPMTPNSKKLKVVYLGPKITKN